MKIKELAMDMIEECESHEHCEECKYDMFCFEANFQYEPSRWELDGLTKKLDTTLRLAKEINKFVDGE